MYEFEQNKFAKEESVEACGDSILEGMAKYMVECDELIRLGDLEKADLIAEIAAAAE